MASLRSFIFFYVLSVFTLFNSKWAEKSLNNIPRLPNINNIHLLDVYEQADMNTKALPAISKILKYSTRKEDYYTGDIWAAVYSVGQKPVSIVSEFVVCGVKSFLHLLQLF